MGNPLSFLDQSFDVHLLLEDWRTYFYLDKLFPTPPIKLQMIPVGGCKGVSTLVGASWQKVADPPVHAFGLMDRDFGHDNVALWQDKSTHVFCPAVHEVENFLLDWEALSKGWLSEGCEKAADDFRGLSLAKATDMLYDVACSDVIAQLQSQYGAGFPKQPQNRKPPKHLSSLDEARDFIAEDIWFRDRSEACSGLFDRENLLALLTRAVDQYKAALASTSDDWKNIFPGKEIFESVVHTVFEGRVNLEDMVKSIGEYQYSNNRIPKPLSDLMKELQRRKALAWL